MLANFDYLVIAFYLLFLVVVGWLNHRKGRDSDEYFRGKGEMAWWLVGASTFMASFSAFTFTGAAGLTHDHGIIVLLMYLGNVLVYTIHGTWLAVPFRRTRVIVQMEAIRNRLGKVNEQFFTWLGLPIYVVHAGVQLYGMAVFCAPVFGIDMKIMILIAGGVIIFMTVSGGSWAVTVGDFLQSMMLLPICVVMAVYSLIYIGGFGNLVEKLPASTWDITASHVKQFGAWFVVAMLLDKLVDGMGLTFSGRYLGLRSERDAKRAAFLTAGLYIVGCVIWFIPPLVARALNIDLAEQFAALSKPSEGAYVVMAKLCLPIGLMGLLVTGIMSTTISSMDMGMNRNAGTFIRSFYLPVLRPRASERELVTAGRFATLAFGGLAMCTALLYSTWKDLGVLGLMWNISALIGVPAATPMFWCLILRKAPNWAAWSTVLVGLLIGCIIGLLPPQFSQQLPAGMEGVGAFVQALQRHDFAASVLFNFTACSLWYFGVSSLFPLKTGSSDLEAANAFFARMRRPLAPNEEGNKRATFHHAIGIGKMAMSYSLFIALLLLIPNNLAGRAGILFCSLSIGVVGALLFFINKKRLAEPPAEVVTPQECVNVNPILNPSGAAE